MKKNYKKPLVELIPLAVDADYALSCGLSVGAVVISCLAENMPNEYEELVYGFGLPPSAPINNDIAFSNSNTCLASCYHGPYDLFFSS